jgi:tetratricopeptide (TPR) repeat protein
LEAKKNFEEAEQIFKRAFEGRKKMLGEFHIQTCDTAFNLADMYRKINRPKPAIDMYRHALQGYSNSLGVDHNNTVVTIQRLDEVLAADAAQCHCIVS